MTTFLIPDMSCGHCKAAIEAAILKLDSAAKVQVDLSSRRVDVASSQPDAALIAALNAVGFLAQTA